MNLKKPSKSKSPLFAQINLTVCFLFAVIMCLSGCGQILKALVKTADELAEQTFESGAKYGDELLRGLDSQSFRQSEDVFTSSLKASENLQSWQALKKSDPDIWAKVVLEGEDIQKFLPKVNAQEFLRAYRKRTNLESPPNWPDLKGDRTEFRPISGVLNENISRLSNLSHRNPKPKFVVILPIGEQFENVFKVMPSVSQNREMASLRSGFKDALGEDLNLLGSENVGKEQLRGIFQDNTDAAPVILFAHSAPGEDSRHVILPDGTPLSLNEIHLMALNEGTSCLILSCRQNDFDIHEDIRFSDGLLMFKELRSNVLNGSVSSQEQLISSIRKTRAKLKTKRYTLSGLAVSSGVISLAISKFGDQNISFIIDCEIHDFESTYFKHPSEEYYELTQTRATKSMKMYFNGKYDESLSYKSQIDTEMPYSDIGEFDRISFIKTLNDQLILTQHAGFHIELEPEGSEKGVLGDFLIEQQVGFVEGNWLRYTVGETIKLQLKEEYLSDYLQSISDIYKKEFKKVFEISLSHLLAKYILGDNSTVRDLDDIIYVSVDLDIDFKEWSKDIIEMDQERIFMKSTGPIKFVILADFSINWK